MYTCIACQQSFSHPPLVTSTEEPICSTQCAIDVYPSVVIPRWFIRREELRTGICHDHARSLSLCEECSDLA